MFTVKSLSKSNSGTKKKKWLLPFFIAFIMVSSMFAIVFSGFGNGGSSSSTDVDVGGVTFSQRLDGRWEAEFNGNLIFVSFQPFSLYDESFIGSEKDPENAYSKEFCGGPHVSNTSEIKSFKILKEKSASKGIRRIYAKVS